VRPRNILYLTWDGPQTNYLESLFLPLFIGLSKRGFKIHVLQFSWADATDKRALDQLFQSKGIPYRGFQICRTPRGIGAFWSVLVGAVMALKLVFRWQIDILMPRSILPASVALLIRSVTRLPIVYDSDGLAADEKVENGGLSRYGVVYFCLRTIETTVIRASRATLARTNFGLRILLTRSKAPRTAEKFFQVSNGKEISKPSSGALASKLTSQVEPKPFTICYAGSWGPQYLPELMLDFAETLKKSIPSLEFFIFTGQSDLAQKFLASRLPLGQKWVQILRVRPEKMSAFLQECDLGLSFRRATLSSRAVAPIKVGEYLLAGLPVVGDAAGDFGSTLVDRGVLFPTSPESIPEAVDWVMKNVAKNGHQIRRKCMEVGSELFDHKRSIDEYAKALNFAIPPSPGGC
jgi:glycosyltransferase involved in cell wall biosynthesis